MFKNIRIVLIETSHPGNIGAVARAMKNMRLGRLCLVNPQQFPSADATARASGADDLLARAEVYPTLEQALTGCHQVFGASARLRTLAWPQVDARECGLKTAVAAQTGEVALVFGRERTGLTNDELERCNYLVHIPTNPEYSSLNIAAAVQVVAYEVLMAVMDKTTQESSPNLEVTQMEDLASADELERFYIHLQQTLEDIDFLDPDNPRQLMRRLKRLFNRATPDNNEMNILRGILSAAQKANRR